MAAQKERQKTKTIEKKLGKLEKKLEKQLEKKAVLKKKDIVLKEKLERASVSLADRDPLVRRKTETL